MIKKLLAGILLATLSSQTLAYWYYEAESPSGYGYGQANSKREAMRLALYHCARHTPTWEVCYITRYFWVD